MEFRYPKTNLGPTFIILGGLGTIGALIMTLYDIFNRNYPPTGLPMLINSSLLFMAGVALHKFYRTERFATIFIDDFGVRHEMDGNIISIPWNEVSEVKWSEKNNLRSITILGNGQQIIIGDKIQHFASIIPIVKDKVGDKFVTYDIPLELKRPIQM